MGKDTGLKQYELRFTCGKLLNDFFNLNFKTQTHWVAKENYKFEGPF